MAPRKPGRYYVDGKQFTKVLNEYHYRRLAAVEAGELEPMVPEFVGESLLKIARNYASSYKFSRVPFKDRDDLVSTGVAYALNAINSTYNPDKMKTGNAFSFATTSIYFGFLGVIQNSKHHFDLKNAATNAFMDGQLSISSSDHGVDISHYATSLANVRELTDTYNAEAEDDTLNYAGKYDAERKKEKDAAKAAKLEEEEKAKQLLEESETEESEGLDVI